MHTNIFLKIQTIENHPKDKVIFNVEKHSFMKNRDDLIIEKRISAENRQ